MKKALLVFLLLGCLTLINFAQTGCPNCVTNNSFTTPDGLPGISVSSFPAGCVGQYYQQDATLYLPGSFTYNGLNLSLRSVVINSVTNFPPGLSWEKNGGGTTWTVNGNTQRGCFRVCGTPTTPGVYNINISVTANVRWGLINQSQTETFVVPLTINPLPAAAGNISGSSAVCAGQTGVSYSVAAITNATSYVWAYSGVGATITGSGRSVTVSFSNTATSGNLTVKGRNSCGDGTISAAFPVNVTPLVAAAGNISGTTTVCQGQAGVGYSVPAITNATSYIWNYTGTGATISGSGNSVNISFSNTATSGILTVKGHNGCGDGTVSPNFSVTVNPLPVAAGIISGPANVCQGQTNVSFSVPVINNATSYIWNYTGTGASINGNSNSITISFAANSTGGVLTVKGRNACGDGTISSGFGIFVNPLPAAAGTISGPGVVCQNSNSQYSVPTINDASSYSWSYTGNDVIISGTSNTVTLTMGYNATSGILTVKGNNGCGDGNVSAPFPVTVNPLPGAAGSITGPVVVCQGQSTITYSVPAVSNAVSYQWAYTGTGVTINGSDNTVTLDFAVNATSGNLTVEGVNDCGRGMASPALLVEVNNLPGNAGPVSGEDTVCQGSFGVFYEVPVITNAVDYVWEYSGYGATILNSGNSVTIDFNTDATSGILTVKGHSGCGFGTVASFPITVMPLPGPAGNISGSTTVCQGQSGVLYTVSPVLNADSYVWEYSGTGVRINGSTTSVTLDFSINATSGVLTVAGNNECGEGLKSADFNITVDPLPGTAGSISGSNDVCPGQNGVIYSVPVIPFATEYVWNYSGTGATITGNSNSVSIDFDQTATDGILTVYGTNYCGNGIVSGGFSITVHPYPDPAGLISGQANVCIGQAGVTYSVPVIGFADDYLWTYSGTGATINGTANSITIDFAMNATSGNLVVTGRNMCGSGIISDDFPVNIFDCYVGIQDNQDGIFLNVVPNPNNGRFNLLTSSPVDKVCEFSVFSSTGQMVSTNRIFISKGLNTYTIDLSAHSDGLYFIQIQSDESVVSKKLIINK